MVKFPSTFILAAACCFSVASGFSMQPGPPGRPNTGAPIPARPAGAPIPARPAGSAPIPARPAGGPPSPFGSAPPPVPANRPGVPGTSPMQSAPVPAGAPGMMNNNNNNNMRTPVPAQPQQPQQTTMQAASTNADYYNVGPAHPLERRQWSPRHYLSSWHARHDISFGALNSVRSGGSGTWVQAMRTDGRSMQPVDFDGGWNPRTLSQVWGKAFVDLKDGRFKFYDDNMSRPQPYLSQHPSAVQRQQEQRPIGAAQLLQQQMQGQQMMQQQQQQSMGSPSY